MTSSLKSKIVDRAALLAMTSAARDAGRTIVQCHGCFDIVHPGHVRYLEFARRQGDILIVSLTGDSEASDDAQRAYISEALRAESVAALMFVDYVYIDPSPTAESILKAVAPDVYVKGSEYEHSCDPGFLAETAVVEGYGGRIIFSSGEPIFSSTELMERVPNRDQQQSHRLKMVTRRHGITSSTIESTLDRLRGLHVLVVGDVVLDRYVLCDAMGVASESPMMSLVRRDEREYVGGAAIVARHVVAMGAHAFLLSAGGCDDRSRRVTDVLAAEGVAYQLIESRPSIVEKVRYVADDTKILKVDCGTRMPLDSVAERHAALIIEQQSKVADAVIFCDFGYGMITGGLLSRVLPTLRHNVPVLAADVSGGRVDLAQFQNVDLLCPTERELRMALNDHDSGLSAVAWNLLERTQARHLLVTLEERGVVVFERRNQDRRSSDWSARLRSEQLPSFADHALDRLGCGDALLAASTLALAAGSSLVQAAYLGNAAAAVEIAMPGNHPVEVDKLRAWLRARPELGFADVPVSKPARASAPSSPAIVPL